MGSFINFYNLQLIETQNIFTLLFLRWSPGLHGSSLLTQRGFTALKFCYPSEWPLKLGIPAYQLPCDLTLSPWFH